ncbi:MAG: hypothetical protein CM1200mP12_21870 [Gammaproteobacteria bacterium]|nr:MAG: hypothetical protein CM1200mP12_21870 [Gammaproteobacteria bacterium]
MLQKEINRLVGSLNFPEEALSRCEFDAHISSEDQYGRYIARLYSNGIDINRKMVSEGWHGCMILLIDKTFYLNQEELKN